MSMLAIPIGAACLLTALLLSRSRSESPRPSLKFLRAGTVVAGALLLAYAGVQKWPDFTSGMRPSVAPPAAAQVEQTVNMPEPPMAPRHALHIGHRSAHTKPH